MKEQIINKSLRQKNLSWHVELCVPSMGEPSMYVFQTNQIEAKYSEQPTQLPLVTILAQFMNSSFNTCVLSFC